MARVMFDTGGRPFLSVTVKGKRARIYWEQRWARYGLLYLGAEFEEEVPVLYLPADEARAGPNRRRCGASRTIRSCCGCTGA
jgi:hypothetical protein